MSVNEVVVVGWARIYAELCTLTSSDGQILRPWGCLDAVKRRADDLEKCGAICRLVLPGSDGIRRLTTIAWPTRFMEAMKIIAVKEREERRARRMVRKCMEP